MGMGLRPVQVQALILFNHTVTLAILLENGLQPQSGETPLCSMTTVLLASLQSCHSVDSDAWCKWASKLSSYLHLYSFKCSYSNTLGPSCDPIGYKEQPATTNNRF